jgi:hypothetical protein
MVGNAVAVKNEDGRRLAVFSLDGSYAAIMQLMQCWDRIGGRSPQGGSDPFIGVSDPF